MASIVQARTSYKLTHPLKVGHLRAFLHTALRFHQALLLFHSCTALVDILICYMYRATWVDLNGFTNFHVNNDLKTNYVGNYIPQPNISVLTCNIFAVKLSLAECNWHVLDLITSQLMNDVHRYVFIRRIFVTVNNISFLSVIMCTIFLFAHFTNCAEYQNSKYHFVLCYTQYIAKASFGN